MNEELSWGSTLGRSESLLDAPKLGWGESMMSRRREEKVNPVKELGEFAAKSDAQKKQRDTEDRKRWGKQREQGLTFTDPVKNEAGMPPIIKGKFPRNEKEDANIGGIEHEWKITASGTADAPAWTTGEGTMFYLNDGTEATVASTSVEGAAGGIYVHVVRNPATRLVTAQTVEFYAEPPLTTETDQFFRLGRVGGTPAIIQDQFTPIRVYEDLFVVNGEFKLGSIAMLADNLYTPPV
jgi:hypothetical protein